MSTPFTAVGSGTGYDPLHIDTVNELITAFNEHMDISSRSHLKIALRVAGDDAHKRDSADTDSPFYAMQVWMENAFNSWADWTQTDTGDRTGNFNNQASIPNFASLAAFRTAAGLPNGFRRATSWDLSTDDWTDYNDGMFSYGHIQVGDILGPWIYEDLQAIMSAASWTQKTSGITATNDEQRTIPTQQVLTNCTDVRNASLAAWTASSWVGGGGTFYRAFASILNPAPYWESDQLRMRAAGTGTVSTLLPVAIDVYAQMTTYILDYYDIDSLGITEDYWYYFETLVAAQTATRTTSVMDISSAAPLLGANITCPIASDTFRSIEATDMKWVLKWDWTYENP